MSPNPFRIDTAFPPQPPQQGPLGYPPAVPPGYPPFPPPEELIQRGRRPRRWPLIVAAGVLGAVVASVAAVTISLQSRDSGAAVPAQSAAPVTVEVAAPTSVPPAPLPTAQADRQTCQDGYVATQAPIKSATDALSILPPGVKVLDPAVQQNGAWADAVRSAGSFYTEASDALQSKIAPGTTPVLAAAANTAAKAYRVLGNSYKNFEPIAGNAHDMAQEVSDQMAVLCKRLAP